MTLTLSCDDFVDELYVDDRRYSVDNQGIWDKTATIVVPAGSRTLAIRCTDYGGVSGVMVATSNGLITGNGKWRCTDNYHHNWMKMGYYDKSWPRAVVKGNNGGSPWTATLPNMKGAKWIWTPAKGNRGTVYCRVDLQA